MPYVVRDENDEITSITLEPSKDTTEHLPIEHPDVLDFLGKSAHEDDAKRLLDDYDNKIPRVLEDLVDILIRKHVVHFDEFPEAAQKKLRTRQYLRDLIRQINRDNESDQ